MRISIKKISKEVKEMLTGVGTRIGSSRGEREAYVRSEEGAGEGAPAGGEPIARTGAGT
jgi:hypothetical protein